MIWLMHICICPPAFHGFWNMGLLWKSRRRRLRKYPPLPHPLPRPRHRRRLLLRRRSRPLQSLPRPSRPQRRRRRRKCRKRQNLLCLLRRIPSRPRLRRLPPRQSRPPRRHEKAYRCTKKEGTGRYSLFLSHKSFCGDRSGPQLSFRRNRRLRFRGFGAWAAAASLRSFWYWRMVSSSCLNRLSSASSFRRMR